MLPVYHAPSITIATDTADISRVGHGIDALTKGELAQCYLLETFDMSSMSLCSPCRFFQAKKPAWPGGKDVEDHLKSSGNPDPHRARPAKLKTLVVRDVSLQAVQGIKDLRFLVGYVKKKPNIYSALRAVVLQHMQATQILLHDPHLPLAACSVTDLSHNLQCASEGAQVLVEMEDSRSERCHGLEAGEGLVVFVRVDACGEGGNLGTGEHLWTHLVGL
ncbi:hypothetical protein JDV02_009555 [Purpureocillium takamizusanense]|uniref:Uncharacterized protein n=1 Tax=Purpureocillium takamizusanense TaxID=2060973 RepID=A0A9Q8QM91_9HYPO|nr:uncharacterized protein JDV02_009555 [Purpureocillium takamizusanense]UNI23754.1 hypothetical protein JDV02_009555 [Purpureocillium takamizusanense]